MDAKEIFEKGDVLTLSKARGLEGKNIVITNSEYECQYYDMTGYIGLEHLIDRNIEKKVSMSEYFKHATKREIAKAL